MSFTRGVYSSLSRQGEGTGRKSDRVQVNFRHFVGGGRKKRVGKISPAGEKDEHEIDRRALNRRCISTSVVQFRHPRTDLRLCAYPKKA